MVNTAGFIETPLTAPGSSTSRDMRAYKHFVAQYTVASIDTSVDVRVEGSNDNTNFFNVDETGDTTISANGTYAIKGSNFAFNFIRFTFVSEVGGTAATINADIKIMD